MNERQRNFVNDWAILGTAFACGCLLCLYVFLGVWALLNGHSGKVLILNIIVIVASIWFNVRHYKKLGEQQ